jgi:hypothetical protein
MITWLIEELPGIIDRLWWRLRQGWQYEWGPRPLWRMLKRFVQRGARGWADEDVWSFDYYLTDVIVGGLHHIMQTSHGVPAAFWDSGGDYEEHKRRWHAALNTMIQGFGARRAIMNDEFMEKQPDGEWTVNHEKLAELQRQADEGMKLFVAHFDALWT